MEYDASCKYLKVCLNLSDNEHGTRTFLFGFKTASPKLASL